MLIVFDSRVLLEFAWVENNAARAPNRQRTRKEALSFIAQAIF